MLNERQRVRLGIQVRWRESEQLQQSEMLEERANLGLGVQHFMTEHTTVERKWKNNGVRPSVKRQENKEKNRTYHCYRRHYRAARQMTDAEILRKSIIVIDRRLSETSGCVINEISDQSLSRATHPNTKSQEQPKR
jgi:hypothetical protein